MDVTEMILFQHHQQRRMFAELDDVPTSDVRRLADMWARLRVLLEVHAEAEEKFFYPLLLEVGAGAGGKDSAASETKDAISDHNDIRDAIAAAQKQEVGTEGWWEAVLRARKANGDHMAEEERQDLADFRRHASLERRHQVALDFGGFEAANSQGVDRRNLDADDYVARAGHQS